jgi:hypothetical protein
MSIGRAEIMEYNRPFNSLKLGHLREFILNANRDASQNSSLGGNKCHNRELATFFQQSER